MNTFLKIWKAYSKLEMAEIIFGAVIGLLLLYALWGVFFLLGVVV
jgi:hypothetical protein